MNVTPTTHERAELGRFATAMYARGRNDLGHLASAVAANPQPTLAQFDRAKEAYRAWLCFDEPKAGGYRHAEPWQSSVIRYERLA